MPAHSPQACAAEFTAALIRRDIDAALAVLANDVVLFYSNGSAIRGRDAFAAMMTQSWKVVEDYAYTSTDAAWIADSDAVASVIYSFHWSGVARGQAVSGSGRGTRVFRRNADAGWLLAHEHLSSGTFS